MFAQSLPESGAASWIFHWPQFRLLLELARLIACSGRPDACHRLRERLQVCRLRLRGAPALVESTLAELWLAAGLVLDGELPTARQHVYEAGLKAEQVERLRCEEIRRQAYLLCCKAERLRAESQQIIGKSRALRATSLVLHRPRRPLPPVLASTA